MTLCSGFVHDWLMEFAKIGNFEVEYIGDFPDSFWYGIFKICADTYGENWHEAVYEGAVTVCNGNIQMVI